MGKKILKSGSEKKQLNSALMKVLRPKVYITDSSSFKSLVQQLTGNGTSPSSSPSSSSSSSSLPQIVENLVPVDVDVELIDDHGRHGNPESSMETSSFDESVEACNQLAFMSSEEINQAYRPMRFEETITSSENLFMNILQHDQVSLANGDIQTLLQQLDDDDDDSFNLYSQIEQELSIYDYELSGLI
ncbi:hypothetical protein PTKIN_Ptkin15bG0174600 [Pterospermum kingtungense]